MPSAMAPDETSTISRPARFKPAISSAHRADRVMVEAASVVGDEARADLDDDALGGGDGRHRQRRVERQVQESARVAIGSAVSLRAET